METSHSNYFSQPPLLQWLTPSVPWPTTSSFCAGDCPRTLQPPGTSAWSTAAGVWYPGERPGAGWEADWPAGAGSDWMKWAAPALWLTGWRWTACTCCGWKAATRRATASTARRCTCTPRLRQVRGHREPLRSSSLTSSRESLWLCHVEIAPEPQTGREEGQTLP